MAKFIKFQVEIAAASPLGTQENILVNVDDIDNSS